MKETEHLFLIAQKVHTSSHRNEIFKTKRILWLDIYMELDVARSSYQGHLYTLVKQNASFVTFQVLILGCFLDKNDKISLKNWPQNFLRAPVHLHK